MYQNNTQFGIAAASVIAIVAVAGIIGAVSYFNAQPRGEIIHTQGQEMVEHGESMMKEAESMMQLG